MSIKEKLKKLKSKSKDSDYADIRDNEFEAELENHELGNQNMYRLYYLDYHRINESERSSENNVGVIEYSSKPFMLPEGMSREDAFKVLSYLTDYLEREMNIRPCSYNSVFTLDNALDLERLSFKKLDMKLDANDSSVIDLFTVTGRLLLFKNSEQYKKYFEWYTENVTLDEVKNIYKKCGIDFYDLIIGEKTEEAKTEDKDLEGKEIDNKPKCKKLQKPIK